MTTQEALEQQTKRSKEQLDNAMSELKETMNEIIKLRQWLDFENIDNRLF